VFLADPVSAPVVPFVLTAIVMAILNPTVLAPSGGVAFGTFVVGACCMFLATRRFERLDF
jgi:hypothetical protein